MDVRGALYGATLAPISRKGDLKNAMSLGSASIFLAKDRFKENAPYSERYTNGVRTVVFNLHFLAEARRQLSGTEEPGTSTFSAAEARYWNVFMDYQVDALFPEEMLFSLEALDDWLVNEVTLTGQVKLDREYSETHPWRKTEEFVHDKGILWI